MPGGDQRPPPGSLGPATVAPMRQSWPVRANAVSPHGHLEPVPPERDVRQLCIGIPGFPSLHGRRQHPRRRQPDPRSPVFCVAGTIIEAGSCLTVASRGG